MKWKSSIYIDILYRNTETVESIDYFYHLQCPACVRFSSSSTWKKTKEKYTCRELAIHEHETDFKKRGEDFVPYLIVNYTTSSKGYGAKEFSDEFTNRV